MKKKYLSFALVGAMALTIIIAALCTLQGTTGETNPFLGTFWSLIPPLVAIVLALITKEVYSSLFVGIFTGALLYNRFSLVDSVVTTVQDGLVSAVSGTAGIFVFLVVLGALVALIHKSGASAAFGTWAETHIKSRTGAMLATFALGVLIFIDDYFNCLTVGGIMRPVTDRQKISRPKLAYLIDATAAPICMIAPISSWAAAVSEYTSGVTDASGNAISSLALFCKAIPYNFYSLLTLVFVLATIFLKVDYGPMKTWEERAQLGMEEKQEEDPSLTGNPRGKVLDLLIPIGALIVVSVLALVYVGGFFGGEFAGDFIGAFGNTDATIGLPLGGVVVLIFTAFYFAGRKLVSLREAMDCLPKGFNAMVPAILVLTMATSLKTVTGLLESDQFVKAALAGAETLQRFLPAMIFLAACGIAFATGTSWGTFGILIPIVLEVFPGGSELLIIGISACLAGAVCGDHCSPISDTTIMSSAGAQCDHVTHVSTQLPYAVTVAVFSFLGFLMASFIQNWCVILPVVSFAMIGFLILVKKQGTK